MPSKATSAVYEPSALGGGTAASSATAHSRSSAAILTLPRKAAGAYYTPDGIVQSLIRWAVRDSRDRLLDPSCGDGRFIALHSNSVGVEKDAAAVQGAARRAPASVIHHADFFQWAAGTRELFDCAVGNPPFIRYQRFGGQERDRAISLCAKYKVAFSGLTSSWAPFLVAAATLLRAGGRMAFVVPAEIGHAPYSAPLLEFLVNNFTVVQVVAVRDKLFPDLSEDCWLLYCEGFGGHSTGLRFTALPRLYPSTAPPRADLYVQLSEWRIAWKRRLRPYLMSEQARRLYQDIAARPDTKRLRELASVGIGYVSGGNDFFHLRPSTAAALGLPNSLLRPTVRNGRLLTSMCLTTAAVERWRRDDNQYLLLNIPKEMKDVPTTVRQYLDSDAGQDVREGYKCRNRQPWYSVPDVSVPDFFLTYLSGRSVNLVRNDAGVTCTNALHYVRLKQPQLARYLTDAWRSSFTELSCEVEGHPLGGGVLKLEPREAGAVLLRSIRLASAADERCAADAAAVMRSWRHYC